MSRQEPTTVARNEEFFGGSSDYRDQIAQLDSYRHVRDALDREVAGSRRLLDVGNGGVCEYDPALLDEVVAVDLFLDRLPRSRFPPNVTPRRGDALRLDEVPGSYDAAVQAFLYHHLTGAAPADMVKNVRQAIGEVHGALAPGGKLIVAESCVPRWFHAVEKLCFRPLVALTRTPFMKHPATFQLPFPSLVGLVAERFEIERAYPVPVGRWLSQFGHRWPTALTPARPYVVVARKT